MPVQDGFTFTVVTNVPQPIEVQEIAAVPAEIPVAVPVIESIVATEISDDVHLPPEAPNEVESPMQTLLPGTE